MKKPASRKSPRRQTGAAITIATVTLSRVRGGTMQDNTSRDTRLDVSRRYGGGGGGGDQQYDKEPTNF